MYPVFKTPFCPVYSNTTLHICCPSLIIQSLTSFYIWPKKSQNNLFFSIEFSGKQHPNSTKKIPLLRALFSSRMYSSYYSTAAVLLLSFGYYAVATINIYLS